MQFPHILKSLANQCHQVELSKWVGPSINYFSTGRVVKKYEKSDLIFLGLPTGPIFFKGWVRLAAWPNKNTKKKYKIMLVDFGKRYTKGRIYTLLSTVSSVQET